MRKAYNDTEAIQEEDKIWGVNLGYDFCAEHEWGVTGIVEQLGLKERSKRCLGIQNKLIRNKEGISHGIVEFWVRKGSAASHTKKHGYSPKKAYYFETSGIASWSSDRGNILQRGRVDLIATYDIEEGRKDLWSEWDKRDFRLVTTSKDLYDALVGALEAGELTFGLSNNKNLFANSGLLMIDARAFSDELKAEMESDELAYMAFQKKADKVKKQIDKKLKEKKLSYYALSPREIDKEQQQKHNTKYDMAFWLNPSDQRAHDSGWYSVEELYQWAKGEGPVIKEKNEVES